MTDEPRLFREEAIRAHVRSTQQGRLLQVTPAWIGRAFWCLLAFAFAIVVAAAIVKVDRVVVGTAVVGSGGHMLAVFPPHARDELGDRPTVIARFLGNAHASAESVYIGRVDDVLVGTQWYDHQALFTTDRPMLVIEAHVRDDAPVGSHGRAEIRVGQSTILDLLRPGRD